MKINTVRMTTSPISPPDKTSRLDELLLVLGGMCLTFVVVVMFQLEVTLDKGCTCSTVELPSGGIGTTVVVALFLFCVA